MNRAAAFFTVLVAGFGSTSPTISGEVSEPDPARPVILTHYMTWFETKPTSKVWGWHWTMGHFDPERIDSTGKREIASHLYPLIGPYDSADPDVLEYHTLLMRIAGIDGVIVDWYGTRDFNDYAMIHRRTVSLFDSLKRVGMKFAVCYEDRALKALVEHGKLSPGQALDQGKSDLRFCAEKWFGDPAYARWDGRPLLLVFGPEYLKQDQWVSILLGLQPSPAFLTLNERREPAIGSFAWPPMWASKDGVLTTKALDEYLDRFYKQDGPKIAGAFPGFHDIYKEAGAQPTYGFLDPRNGETLDHTLVRAKESGSPFIQTITWNDFGEGTCIEPTREHGYTYLEKIQAIRLRSGDRGFPYTAADLRLPFRVYELRKHSGLSAEARGAIDGIVSDLFTGEVGTASKRLEYLMKRGGN
ncbi:MAG: glycoside hydrolase family 71/99-like protein [Isosphaeraceae bacterium]